MRGFRRLSSSDFDSDSKVDVQCLLIVCSARPTATTTFFSTNSWVYNQIANDKKDTFLESGEGFGKTFNYWFPLRIDFILTDKNVSVNSYQSFQKQQNSDHFPILTNISF